MSPAGWPVTVRVHAALPRSDPAQRACAEAPALVGRRALRNPGVRLASQALQGCPDTAVKAVKTVKAVPVPDTAPFAPLVSSQMPEGCDTRKTRTRPQ